MIKKTFEKVDEELFIEKLDNGITVYMYPTKKTKNFYLSISVKYGACVEKYKVLNKLNRVIIQEFINKIYIGKVNDENKTRKIKIKWNFD